VEQELTAEAAVRVAEFRAALRKFLRNGERVARACGLTPQRYLLLLMIKGAPDGREQSTVTDLAGTRRTLHHVRRPELVLAELTRVTAPGGRILVDDQIAPADPLVALELDRFERARDPSHTRTLSDVEIRALFEANSLVLERSERAIHRRELGPYLELAGCIGEAADAARALSPGGPEAYTAETAWYVLRKRD